MNLCFVLLRSLIQVSITKPCIRTRFADFISFMKIERYDPRTSVSTLVNTQPPVQWVLEVISLGTGRPERKVDHLSPPSTEIKNVWSNASFNPYTYSAFTELYLYSPREGTVYNSTRDNIPEDMNIPVLAFYQFCLPGNK